MPTTSIQPCIIVDDQPASCDILSRYIQRTEGLQLSACFSDGLAAIAYLQMHPEVSFLFLDVEMPGISGFDLLSLIQQNLNYPLPLVILSTGHVQYATKGYHYDRVVGFLEKVIDYPSFLMMVEKARRILKNNTRSESTTHQFYDDKHSIFIKTSYNRKERYERVYLQELHFIQGDRNYIRLVSSSKEYVLKHLLGGLEKQLDPKRFVRVHKSYIVNLSRIHRIEGKEIIMEDGKAVPLSDSYRPELMHRISQVSIEDH
jgi:DNA-binding LytR/AlgR family response regulator